MAEPRLRFKRDDGSNYPTWQEYALGEILTERNEPHLITEDAPQLSFTIEKGVIYPEDKKTNKRDFLMKDKDNKKFLLTEYNDIIYNPANLKFGAIHRNALGRGVVSPIYAIFSTNQNPEFIEGIVTNPAFIKSSLKYLEGTVEKLKTLKPRDFVKMHVWVPCIEEQQKIADFLSNVDEVISASEQEVANLESQKKAVMKTIFSQEVRFKRTDGSEFPEWKEKAIREFAQCIAGATPSTKVDDYWKDGTIPWMSSGEVHKGLVFETNAKITQCGYDNTSTKMVPADTVVMALAGQGKTRGTVALTKIELCTNQSLCAIVSDDSVNSAYLYQYLKTQYQNLRHVSSGDGTRGGLNLQLVGDYVVLIPCLEEQCLIADFFSDFDEAIAAAKRELELWKELRKGLLQQMFV